MAYEDILIQESTGEGGGWSLDRTEATADWYDNVLDETVGSTGDGDVCFPAPSPVPLQLDWPAWRLSFSAYGEHMGWEVPQ